MTTLKCLALQPAMTALIAYKHTVQLCPHGRDIGSHLLEVGLSGKRWRDAAATSRTDTSVAWVSSLFILGAFEGRAEIASGQLFALAPANPVTIARVYRTDAHGRARTLTDRLLDSEDSFVGREDTQFLVGLVGRALEDGHHPGRGGRHQRKPCPKNNPGVARKSERLTVQQPKQ